MPRTLRPLVLAALTGCALTFGLIGLLSMSQATPAGQHVLVAYGPHPRDMVQIKEGTPYVVPPGELFVLSALGTSADGSFSVHLRVNGIVEVNAIDTGSPRCSVIPAAPVFTVPAGSTVDVLDAYNAPGSGRAWGYLANE